MNTYQQAGGSAKTAIVMVLAGCDKASAEQRLTRSGGFIRGAIADHPPQP